MKASATPPSKAPQADSTDTESIQGLVEQAAGSKTENTGDEPAARPQIRIDPAMVAETLQRKNAQLISQLVYDNAVLETALETAHRDIADLTSKNAALRNALGA